jgi:hypothetical protein
MIRPAVDFLGFLAQHAVFSDDLPIVESQHPRDADETDTDRLVPSDAAIIAFRKMRRAHRQEARGPAVNHD